MRSVVGRGPLALPACEGKTTGWQLDFEDTERLNTADRKILEFGAHHGEFTRAELGRLGMNLKVAHERLQLLLENEKLLRRETRVGKYGNIKQFVYEVASE